MASKKAKKTTLSFDQRLAKAKAAPRPSEDVEIILDAGLGEKIDALRDELMAAQEQAVADLRLTGPDYSNTDAIQAKLDEALQEAADMVVTLRFTQMPAPEWADVTSRCPLRIDVPLDRQYGFNTDMIAAVGAPLSGRRIEDGELYGLTDEQWRDLFETISGNEIRRIADALFKLNEYMPAERLAEAKKVLAARLA